MCGRMTLEQEAKELAELFEASWQELPEMPLSNYNICPTNEIAVLRNQPQAGTGRRLDLMHWGIIPPWKNEEKGFGGFINARLETVQEKPSFRDCIGERQCLIPVSGYYEWLTRDKKKVPFYLQPPAEQALLLMAGLWNDNPQADGSRQLSCSIITRPASKNIAFIHDRMPLLLNKRSAAAWLRGAFDQEQLLDLSLTEVKYHQVGKEVNSNRSRGAPLILPTAHEQGWQEELF